MSVKSDAKKCEPNSNQIYIPPTAQDDDTQDNQNADQVFIERHHFNLDQGLDYPRAGSDPGKIIIINQENIPNDFREGSRRDVNELVLCFQRLGFNIARDDIHTDLTVDKLTKIINEALQDKDRLKSTNCFILIILSHGLENDEFMCIDKNYSITTILKMLIKCEELNNKPKMIIVQACKGKSFAITAPSDSLGLEKKPSIVSQALLNPKELGPDMLIAFATIEGNESYRSELTGSWFIQELCKTFSSYGRRDDVLSLLTRLNKHISFNYYHPDSSYVQTIKQMPAFVSTLSKKFYLNRNKDRHILLEILRETDEIYSMLQSIANLNLNL